LLEQRDNLLKYHFVVERSKDVIWTMELNGFKYKFISKSCYGILGYTPEERMTHTLKDIYPPESVERVTNIINSAIEKYKETKIEPEVQYEIQQYHKNGNLV
jgi:PAS domain S-box-containing protein